jgi:hypothetical protein
MPLTAEQVFKDHLGQLHMEMVRLQLVNSELADELTKAKALLSQMTPPVAEIPPVES